MTRGQNVKKKTFYVKRTDLKTRFYHELSLKKIVNRSIVF
jgi:hypothetical protein